MQPKRTPTVINIAGEKRRERKKIKRYPIYIGLDTIFFFFKE